MVCLIAMQGLGKPGVNMGNLQWGAPVDLNFISRATPTGVCPAILRRPPWRSASSADAAAADHENAAAKNSRIFLPEAILEGKADGGYPWNGKWIEPQFAKFSYPAAGHSPVRMMFKFGGSLIPTMNNTNRHVKMFQSPNLEFIVSQAIWFEGDTKFADVILPACTNFERADISEWAGSAVTAITASSNSTSRHIFQAPAIEPLGESKSDFWISMRFASASASPTTSPRRE